MWVQSYLWKIPGETPQRSGQEACDCEWMSLDDDRWSVQILESHYALKTCIDVRGIVNQHDHIYGIYRSYS